MTKRIVVLSLLLACCSPILSSAGIFFGHRRFATRNQGAYHAPPAPSTAQPAPAATDSAHKNIVEELRSQTIGGFKIDDMLDPYMRARNTDFR